MEHTDGSEMCISVMTVILMSLGAASASGEVAELFCRSRFAGRAVDVVIERGLVVGASDRLDDRQRGPAEVARGGAASAAGRRSNRL